jgi:hypothetical protein
MPVIYMKRGTILGSPVIANVKEFLDLLNPVVVPWFVK